MSTIENTTRVRPASLFVLVIALPEPARALPEKSHLTLCELQHLTIRTAEAININDPDCDKAASGRLFSYKDGYDRLNGPSRRWLIDFDRRDEWRNTLPYACGLRTTAALTLRSVEVISPNGVKSILAARRLVDTNKDGYPAWHFMSAKHWPNAERDQGMRPRGTWTIRVSDIGAKDRTVCSSVPTIDASIARSPDVPPVGDHPSTTTKAHPKHTEHLPGNHKAEGEADKPAFENGDFAEDTALSSSSGTAPSGTVVPTADDEGWFPDMSTITARFPVMTPRGGRGARTNELYDAFGERGDDEDEYTGLGAGFQARLGGGGRVPRRPRATRIRTRLGTMLTYRDELEKRDVPPRWGAASPHSGSGEESWEYASQTSVDFAARLAVDLRYDHL
ncbi:hypothetical protein EDB92DRAFT_1814636 [Lactarius akahatsu]|uniref:P/Homo B domain-containing protein n=1 Tax=Lactarius akahatsu TaxID=416441 RepID=A0AAD4QFE1_9AGAM|nr:hypothetical protein EDB92DRAFT_1814636 [Lactarius akahatsu]